MLRITNAHVWEWDERDGLNGGVQGLKTVLIDRSTGRLVNIGTDIVVSENIDTIDAKGQLLLPGLHDAHIHVANTGETRYYLDLAKCNSIPELISAISRHYNEHHDLPWIIGVNWDQTKCGRYPNRFDLDSACSGRPVFLWRVCWHIGVANTAALNAFGIDCDCTEFHVEGGSIDVFNESNRIDVPSHVVGPTGILKETACNIVYEASGSRSFLTLERKMKFIEDGLHLCLSMGLTSVHTNDEKCVTAYQSLQQQNKLPIRVFLTPYASDLDVNQSEGGILGLTPFQSQSLSSNADIITPDDRLTIERVKLFSDGSLGAETAALRTSQGSVECQHKGILYYSDGALHQRIRQAKDNGYRLEVHCIGDAAADQVLTAFEQCGVAPEDRAIITHCQVLGDDLMHRMEALGVIANIQPSFVPTDMRWVNERITARWQYDFSYAWKTLLKRNIHVAGGSDSPIEHCSPIVGMYDAIYRRHREDKTNVFRPEECLSFAEAVYIYTVGACYAAGCENVLGRIEPGYVADLILLDCNVISNPELLRTAQPSLVMVGGQVVYRETEELTSAATTLSGPFVPGKNGLLKRHPFQCLCHPKIPAIIATKSPKV